MKRYALAIGFALSILSAQICSAQSTVYLPIVTNHGQPVPVEIGEPVATDEPVIGEPIAEPSPEPAEPVTMPEPTDFDPRDYVPEPWNVYQNCNAYGCTAGIWNVVILAYVPDENMHSWYMQIWYAGHGDNRNHIELWYSEPVQ